MLRLAVIFFFLLCLYFFHNYIIFCPSSHGPEHNARHDRAKLLVTSCVWGQFFTSLTQKMYVSFKCEHVRRPFVIAQKFQRTPLEQRNYSMTGVHYILHTGPCCTVAIG